MMTVVWDSGRPMTVREVMHALEVRERVLAYTTVATVLVNLRAKGWLGRSKKGRIFTYTAVCTRSEYAAGLARQALDHSDDATASLVALVSHMSPDQRSALETALRIAGTSQEEADRDSAPGGDGTA